MTNDQVSYPSGANVNARDDDSYTPLLTAASLGEVEAFRALMEDPHVQLDAVDKKGKSAVFLAAEEGHTDVLEVNCFGPFIPLVT